jgi:hypothetical protein
VEQPHPRVVCDDTQAYGVAGWHLNSVASDGVCLSLESGRVERRVGGSVVLTAPDDLEFVAVQVAVDA